MTKKKIKIRKCVTVVVKEVVMNIYILFGWMEGYLSHDVKGDEK